MSSDRPLAGLAGEVTPPAALEQRVRQDLRARGLIGGPGWRHWGPGVRRVLATAAAVLLFVSGVMVGRQRDQGSAEGGARFALLLYEPAGFDTTRTHAELAQEYGAWAASLESRFVGGEALGAQRVLGGEVPAASGQVPTGYFLLRASGWEEAMAIAAACPHLRHGGVVAVREIIG